MPARPRQRRIRDIGTSQLEGPGSEILAPRAADAEQAVRSAVRYWWVTMARGCLAVLLGIGALISGAPEHLLVNYIAVYWMLGGVMTIRWALGVRWREGSRIGLTAGILAIAVGLVLVARQELADVVGPSALIGFVAVTIAATGCLRIVGAFEIEERTGHRWTVGGLILGVVELILGVTLFLVRNAQASTVRATIGLWGLVAGSLLLAQGTRMLRARRAIKEGV